MVSAIGNFFDNAQIQAIKAKKQPETAGSLAFGGTETAGSLAFGPLGNNVGGTFCAMA